METLKGTDIASVMQNYENILIIAKNGERVHLTMDELKRIFQTITFDVKLKRVKMWATLETLKPPEDLDKNENDEKDYTTLAEKYLRCGNAFNTHALGIRDFAKWLSHPISVGDTVNVPDPIKDDLHRYAFIGTVVYTYGIGQTMSVVEDQDGECFSIEADRLILLKK